MPDGTFRLRFEHDGFITLEREITIRNGQPQELEVEMSPAPAAPSPPPPAPEPAAPAPAVPAAPSGPPVTVSIPEFLDKNFIGGRDPLKESVLGCTAASTTRLLQLREPIAVHSHDLDEIVYVVAGDGALRLRAPSGDETTVVHAGSLTVIPRGVAHAIERRGRNPLILLSTLAGAPCQTPTTTHQDAKR